MIELLQKVYGIFYGESADIRTEICGSVVFHLSCKEHSGELFIHRDLYERIGLVVCQQGIVFRLVLLDKVALQHQGFHLGIRHDVLKVSYPAHHDILPDALRMAVLKILMQAMAQYPGLSHIYYLITLIMHQIDAR